MRICVIQASSQADKNSLIYDTVRRYAPNDEVINFGCRPEDEISFSYIEISVLIGMLIASGAAGLVITGCSSGQGMMLACNSMPGVICGYAPTPMDAYLFAQINDGNVLSLPLGEGYTWIGKENLESTLEKFFSEPFGQGYPRDQAERKLRDTALLKKIRRDSQTDTVTLLHRFDGPLKEKILKKMDVIDFILANGKGDIPDWIREKLMAAMQ